MAITKPTVITKPFCGEGTEGTDYTIPPQSGSSSVQSQDNGWPAIYQQPLDFSGLPITRLQTNGALFLYSSILAFIQAGGTFTFEQTVSDDNGGYPANQILYYAPSKRYVISLIANNTYNFVTTPACIDGTKWQYLDKYIPSATTTTTGLAQLATDAQAITGTNTTLSVTPHALAAALIDFLPFNPVQQGGGYGQLADDKVYIGWSADNRLKAQVNSTDLGNVVFDSEVDALQAVTAIGSSSGINFRAIYYPADQLISVIFELDSNFTTSASWSDSVAVTFSSVLTALSLSLTISQAININNSISQIYQPSTTFSILNFAAGIISLTISGVTLQTSAKFSGAATGTLFNSYTFNLFVS